MRRIPNLQQPRTGDYIEPGLAIKFMTQDHRQKVILYGGGGGAVEIAKYIIDQNMSANSQSKCEITDVVDDNVARENDLQTITDTKLNFHKSTDTIKELSDKKFVVTLGHSPVRHEICRVLKDNGFGFHTVIHPSSQISPTATVGVGSIIGPYVLVGTFATVGENVFLNVRSTVGHDACLGESTVVSPHVTMGGAVKVGKSVYFGASSVVNPRIVIGDYAKISAGAIVAKDVEAGCMAYMPPARSVRVFSATTGQSLFNDTETIDQ